VSILKPKSNSFENLTEHRLNPVLELGSVTAGGTLAGQTVRVKTGRGGETHTVLDRRLASLPLRLDRTRGAARGAVIFDAAFGSLALAGIGPDPAPGRNALGTGILTLLFDEPQCVVGFRTWLDGWQDNIVMRQFPEGNLNVIFWNRDAEVISDKRRFVDAGLISLAYSQSSGGGPEIMAVTIQNLDPGGIAIDDLIFSPLCPFLVGQNRAFPPLSADLSGRG
jgi:hypothetical protein